MDFVILMVVFLISEYIGDFILQSREIATTKSSNLDSLQQHSMVVGTIVSIAMAGAFSYVWDSPAGILGGIFFGMFYGVIHGFQDACIWKVYKYIRREAGDKFEYWNDKLFYDFIGLDRMLHIITATILIARWS